MLIIWKWNKIQFNSISNSMNSFNRSVISVALARTDLCCCTGTFTLYCNICKKYTIKHTHIYTQIHICTNTYIYIITSLSSSHISWGKSSPNFFSSFVTAFANVFFEIPQVPTVWSYWWCGVFVFLSLLYALTSADFTHQLSVL